MRMPKVVLNNWSVIGHSVVGSLPYCPPEAVRLCLAGEVVGHPSFDDGHYVTTSPLVGSGPVRDGMIVETANTLYMLKGVCPKYKAWCDANSYTVST